MSTFSTLFDAAARDMLYTTFGESVSYTHKADPANSLAAVTNTYTAIPQSSADVAGGSRQFQQPVVWRLRANEVARVPQRGDTLTFDGETWSIVDVTAKRGGLEYRLSAQYAQVRG